MNKDLKFPPCLIDVQQYPCICNSWRPCQKKKVLKFPMSIHPEYVIHSHNNSETLLPSTPPTHTHLLESPFQFHVCRLRLVGAGLKACCNPGLAGVGWRFSLQRWSSAMAPDLPWKHWKAPCLLLASSSLALALPKLLDCTGYCSEISPIMSNSVSAESSGLWFCPMGQSLKINVSS